MYQTKSKGRNQLVKTKENEKHVMQAEQLNILGVFQGTLNGFELDKQATRLERLTMLIRLIEREEDT